MIGTIPKNITYIYSQIRKIDGKDVYPTFISDSDNKKTLETGHHWADWKTNYQTEKVETLTFEIENNPIKSVQILSLEKRGRGGRAYKVIITIEEKFFYVDLREDVLLDAILEVGINKNGYLNGKYIWARVGSDMKLIRVDSSLYKEMKESTRLNSVKINKSQLEIGGVYENKHHQMIYLGEYSTIDCSIKESYIRKYDNHNNQYGYQEKLVVTPEFKIVEKAQLWIPTSTWSPTNCLVVLSSQILNNKTLLVDLKELINNVHGYYFEFAKSKTIKTKLDQLNVPNDLIEVIREHGKNLKIEHLEKREKERNKDYGKDEEGYYPVMYYINSFCKLEHLAKPKSKLEIKEPYNNHMDFIFKNRVEHYNSKL